MRRWRRSGWAAGAAAAVVLGAGCSSGGSVSAPSTTSRPPATSGAPVASSSTSTTSVAGRAAGSGPCGFRSLSGVHYTHVIWVWMENHPYSSVIGSPSAPYENALARQCGLATDYHNVTHPSLPNYIAATSGLPLAQLGPFSSDCDPSPGCSTTAPSLFSQAPSWKAYEESMPYNCDRAGGGEYAVRHNPPVYYPPVAAGCRASDVPYTALARDLAGAGPGLPAFAFVTPNLVHDTHDGSVGDGDRWLAANLAAVFASAAYRAGTVAVFVTWDEGEGGSASDCAGNTTDPGCRVATVVASPSTPAGTRSAALFSHYSLLRTTEQLLGLPPLGQAASAATMAGAFSLAPAG